MRVSVLTSRKKSEWTQALLPIDFLHFPVLDDRLFHSDEE